MAYTTHPSNISIGTPGAGATSTTYTIGAGGAGSSSASVTIPAGGYTLTGSSGTMWNSTYNYSPSVNITQNGISLNSEADIKLGDVSLRDTLEKIQQRLAILVPDPKKLEKYEALKQAYDHYKTLEALCSDDGEEK